MAILNDLSRCIVAVSYALLLVASVILIAIGGSILVIAARYKHVVTVTNLQFPGYIVLGTGLLLLCAGVIGFIACIKHSRCLLVLLYVLLLTILLCKLAVIIVSIFYWPKIREQISRVLHEDLRMYDKVAEVRQIVDFIQSNFECCGVENQSDWKFYNNGSYPQSCCKNRQLEGSFSDKECIYYQYGCLNFLEREVKRYLGYVIGSACTFFLLQLIGLHSMCVVICRSQSIHRWQNEGYISI
ncbi:transmembrane 4 superfamily member, putative [Schistosoma mansoni]|uniref:transmembrane 4 superfamily member, putative n=1 Tax=Schistosoma mansoni TaxID=6183 RepID=UPI0001A642DB|nr:transmembrane 4 superfamily member, putative [Schistosoma mansoni]|eukprot:XP_018644877.1 transmembrane 4 superfamily member, putative [Schistosoma mansoni]